MQPLLIALLLAGFTLTADADEAIHYVGVRAGADLFASPSVRSTVVTHLPFETRLTVLERRNPWWLVDSGTGPNRVHGWILEGAVRQHLEQSTTERSRSSFFSRFASWFRSDHVDQRQTAVLGVRGLDQGGSQASGPVAVNFEAVDWMDKLTVDRSEIDAFIAEGELKP